MKALGLHAYRFSIAWPRMSARRTRPGEPAGLDFYDRLVDGAARARDRAARRRSTTGTCRRRSRTSGGWARATPPTRFAEYAEVVLRRASATASGTGSTLNEPWVAAFLGYASATQAPGPRPTAAALAAAHHLLLVARARGPALSARPGGRASRHRAQPAVDAAVPAATRTAAARRQRRPPQPLVPRPDVPRRYPADLLERLRGAVRTLDAVRDGDLEPIAQPLDLLGLNYYRPICGHREPRGSVLGPSSVPRGA